MKKSTALLVIAILSAVAAITARGTLAWASSNVVAPVEPSDGDRVAGSLTAIRAQSVITPGELTFHPADGAIAYNWFTYVPESISSGDMSYIWVTGVHGNLITDTYEAITSESAQKAIWRQQLAEEHKFHMLVPVIPRPDTHHVYAVAFDWKVFLETTDPFCQRPDAKVNLMIDQFVADLRAAGYRVDDKVFVDGFSAGGMFAQRYAILHPERLHAIAAGQCGGSLTFPESLYTHTATMTTELDWPLGVFDYSTLVGGEFNGGSYQEVAQFIYIGDQDTNTTMWGTGELWRTQAQIDFLTRTFGLTAAVVVKNQAGYMNGLGYDVTFKSYPGIAHQVTSEMISDTFDFFAQVIDSLRERALFVPIVVKTD